MFINYHAVLLMLLKSYLISFMAAELLAGSQMFDYV